MVSLLDVLDVDAFVGAAISRHRFLGLLRGLEREELEGEAFVIMCELAARHDPARGSFSTFAGASLPGRLMDAHRRLHRGEIVRPHRGKPVRRVIASLDAERARPGFDEGRLRVMRDFARAPAV